MALRHALLKMQARLEFCNELKSNVAGLPNNDFLYVDSLDIRSDYMTSHIIQGYSYTTGTI